MKNLFIVLSVCTLSLLLRFDIYGQNCTACGTGAALNINIASGATYSTAISPSAGQSICITGPASGTPANLTSTFTFNGVNNVCFYGRINMSSNLTTNWGNKPVIVINSTATITHSGIFDLSGSGDAQKTYFYNYGTYSNTNTTANWKLIGTEFYNSGSFTISDDWETNNAGSTMSHTNTASGTMNITGKIIYAWNGTTSFTNSGSLTAKCFESSGTVGFGTFTSGTGSNLTFTGINTDCSSGRVFDSGVTNWSINGTMNVPNGQTYFGTTASAASNLTGSRLYLKDLTVSSHAFNMGTGCMSIQITGVMNINSGSSYVGKFFIWDLSYTSATTNNGDIYAGGTVNCVLDKYSWEVAPLNGCRTSNNDWDVHQDLATNKIFYSQNDDGSAIGCVVLPMKIYYFNVSSIKEYNQINFSGDFHDAALVVIERSNNGVHFEDIHLVDPRLLSNGMNYSFKDSEMENTTSYYRIKVISENTKADYSSIVASSIYSFVISPNPASNFFNIVFNEDNFEYVIFDINGQEIMHGEGIEYHAQVNCTSLPNGNYILKLLTNTGSQTTKFSILR